MERLCAKFQTNRLGNGKVIRRLNFPFERKMGILHFGSHLNSVNVDAYHYNAYIHLVHCTMCVCAKFWPNRCILRVVIVSPNFWE